MSRILELLVDGRAHAVRLTSEDQVALLPTIGARAPFAIHPNYKFLLKQQNLFERSYKIGKFGNLIHIIIIQ